MDESGDKESPLAYLQREAIPPRRSNSQIPTRQVQATPNIHRTNSEPANLQPTFAPNPASNLSHAPSNPTAGLQPALTLSPLPPSPISSHRSYPHTTPPANPRPTSPRSLELNKRPNTFGALHALLAVLVVILSIVIALQLRKRSQINETLRNDGGSSFSSPSPAPSPSSRPSASSQFLSDTFNVERLVALQKFLDQSLSDSKVLPTTSKVLDDSTMSRLQTLSSSAVVSNTQSEAESLFERWQRLQAMANTLQSKLQQHVKNRAILTDNFKMLRSAESEIHRRMSDYESQRSRLSVAASTLSELTNRLQEAEHQHQHAKLALDQFEQSHRSQQQEMQALKERLSLSEREVESAASGVDRQKRITAQLEQKVRDTRESGRQLQEKLNHGKDNEKRLTDEDARVLAQIKTLNDQLKTDRVKLMRLEAQQSNLNLYDEEIGKLEKIGGNPELLRRNILNKQAEIDKLKEELRNLQTMDSDGEEDDDFLKKIRQMNENLINQKRMLIADEETRLETMRRFEEDLASQDIGALRHEANERRKRLSDQIGNQKRTVQDLERQLKELNQKHDSLQKELVELKDLLANGSSSMERIELDQKQAEKERDIANRQLETAEDQLHEAKERKDRAQRQLNEQLKEYSSYEQTRRQKEADVTRFVTQVRDIQNSITAEIKRQAPAIDAVTSASNEVQDSVKKHSEIENKLNQEYEAFVKDEKELQTIASSFKQSLCH